MSEGFVLQVEDNPDDMLLVRRALRKSGLDVRLATVRDGVEALDYLFATGKHNERDTGDMPACVLMDMKMPRLSGLEVLRRIRDDRRTRLVPVVMLSASMRPQDLSEAYLLGANSVVWKDSPSMSFAEVVRHTVAYWLLLNEPPPQRSRR